MDATIEKSCLEKMQKILFKFCGLIRRDKARCKAMTLSDGRSLDFYKVNALCRERKCFIYEHNEHQAKDCTVEIKDGGAAFEKSKFKINKDF